MSVGQRVSKTLVYRIEESQKQNRPFRDLETTASCTFLHQLHLLHVQFYIAEAASNISHYATHPSKPRLYRYNLSSPSKPNL